METPYYVLALLPGVGPGELLLIFLAILLIFGPKKLPEVGKALGDCVNQFKKASDGLTKNVNNENQTEHRHQ